MAEVRQVVEEYDDRFLVGETEDVRFLGDGNNMLHSVFNFDITFQKALSRRRWCAGFMRNGGRRCRRGRGKAIR
jgi:hypothetical protein